LLLIFVVLGCIIVGILAPKLNSLLYDSEIAPEKWCADQPCSTVGNIVISQPSSSIIVYLVAFLTVLVGAYFIRSSDAQSSRIWWGMSLILTGIGAGLAGTSYQAFGYEIKCHGYESCLWTSWWELAYMIFTVAGAGAAYVGVSYSSFSSKMQKSYTYYSLISTCAYIIIVIIGMMISNRFLLSFELMISLCLIGGCSLFIITLLKYIQTHDGLLLRYLLIWIGLVLVIGLYYLYYTLDITSILWEKGVWFSENDVLHCCLAIWVISIYFTLRKQLKDK
jgi:hypothetical protein